jgi:uncharacterized protein (TIGR03067 family)
MEQGQKDQGQKDKRVKEMLMIRCWVVVVAVGLLMGADESKPDAKVKDEIAKLQGTWAFVSVEMDGKKTDPNLVKGSKIVIKGDNFTAISGGATYKGTFKVDVAKKPKTLDINFTEGPEKGNTSLAIYELDGDTWKICLTISAKERPKDFATKEGSGVALESLKRQK